MDDQALTVRGDARIMNFRTKPPEVMAQKVCNNGPKCAASTVMISES